MLALALESNCSLRSLNRLPTSFSVSGVTLSGRSPDTLASLFESLACSPNSLLEVRAAGQQQQKMGHRVEARIGDAVLRNPRLLKLGMQFEFIEVMNRVSRHLINNAEKIRKEKKKGNIENNEEKNDSRENQSEKSTTDQNVEVRT